MQINSVIPETDNLEFVNSKLSKVAGGLVLSYQQQQKFTKDPEHGSLYSFVPSLEQLNFMEGLCVTQAQSNLYEEETLEQADTQKWHDLRAQRLSSHKLRGLHTKD